MTVATETQPSLLDTPDTGQPTRPARTSCALCGSPPATAFGLCRGCLAAAAMEHALVAPSAGRRPSAVQARDLCRRCGSGRHPTARCEA